MPGHGCLRQQKLKVFLLLFLQKKKTLPFFPRILEAQPLSTAQRGA
jgi:hypothetical protein